MKKLIIVAALGLALSSCSAIDAAKYVAGITVPPKITAVAVTTFDAVEVSATNYLRLPMCTDGQTTLKDACKDAKVVPQLIKDVRAGRAARDALWASAKANAGSGIKDLYTAVMAAISKIKGDLA